MTGAIDVGTSEYSDGCGEGDAVRAVAVDDKDCVVYGFVRVREK